MSGDVQPRKRKDKKRKRDALDRKSEGEVIFSRQQSKEEDEDESSHGVHITKMGGEDVHLHVQEEHGTGGHWCAKLFFFVLLSLLLGLVGLIILENRGLTDLDTPLSESRFSNYFDGWVDEHREDHDEHDAVQASIEEHDEHDEPFEEEEDHSEVDDEEDDEEEEDEDHNHDNADVDHEEDKDDERDEEDEDEEDNATAEATTEQTEEDENEENDDDDDNVTTEALTNEDDDEEDDNEYLARSKRETIEADGDDDDDENTAAEEDTNEQNDDDGDDDNDNINNENEEDETKNAADQTQEDQNDDDDDNDDEVEENIQSTTASKQTSANKNADDDDDDAFDEEDDDGTFESLENVVVENDAEELLLLQEKARQQTAKEANNTPDSGEENGDNDEAAKAAPSWASSLAVKIGVGVALALVARLVLIRKNPNTTDEPSAETLMKRRLTIATPEDTFPEDEAEADPDAAAAPHLPEDEQEEYSEEEIEIEEEIEYVDDNEEEDVPIDENYGEMPISGKYVPETFEQLNAMYKSNEEYEAVPVTYESIINERAELFRRTSPTKKEPAIFNAPPPPPLVEAKIQHATAAAGSSSPSPTTSLKAEAASVHGYAAEPAAAAVAPTKSAKRQLPHELDSHADDEDIDEEEDEEVYDDDDDDEDDDDIDSLDSVDGDDDEVSDVDDTELMNRLEAKYGRLPAKEYESDEDPDDPTWTRFSRLSQKYPDQAQAFLGKAKSLDHLSAQRRSNRLLGDALEAYKRYLAFGDAIKDNAAYRAAAERYIERIRFMGHHLQAVPIHEQLIERFPAEPSFLNQLAVTYLMSNRLADAKRVLQQTLSRWPSDGFALAHYGFVLKQHDRDYANAIIYLQRGIDSQAEGTQDGRFFFSLGDALQRLGHQTAALAVYKRGAELQLFPSVYQRSLYNEPHLRAQPYWTREETTYAALLKKLEQNWLAIRDEGLSVLSHRGYFADESENLRDSGDWKQFELYARGQRRVQNCQKAPITCALIAEFPAASGCRRGQVKFSVMHPGTHVWPHCGPTNCRLRAHLGLVVPPGTRLRVADVESTWTEGKFLIFDDSFEHEVWHEGDSLRLVLIIDFWHPDLSAQQRQSLTPI